MRTNKSFKKFDQIILLFFSFTSKKIFDEDDHSVIKFSLKEKKKTLTTTFVLQKERLQGRKDEKNKGLGDKKRGLA